MSALASEAEILLQDGFFVRLDRPRKLWPLLTTVGIASGAFWIGIVWAACRAMTALLG